LRSQLYSWYSFTDPGGMEGWLAWVAGYVVKQSTCPKAVTHPTTNRAQCRAIALIETNALPLHVTAIRYPMTALTDSAPEVQLAVIPSSQRH